MYRKAINLVWAAMFAVTLATAQEKNQTSSQFVTDVAGVGTSAATFLEIGAGARAMAMGAAYVAQATDATALYWNPAGIAFIPGFQIEFMNCQWLAETQYNFFGLVAPIPAIRSSVGVSLISLDYGENPVRTVERPEGTGEKYGARDVAVSVSYAMALTDRFSFGLSGKYINQRIWSESGSAVAMDVGVYYNTMLKGLRLGASVSNFGSDIQMAGRHLTTVVDPDEAVQNFDRVPVNYKVGSYSLPLLFRVGLAYTRSLGSLGTITVAGDVNHPSNTTESINLGAEYGFANMFYVRAGYENLYERDHQNGLTFGGGVEYFRRGMMGFRVDYSWADWGILTNTQRFSLGLLF
ncbi:MAG TPA: PorV/PorQ family protein [bacterium]|nr:PorV/PorQ family protein [bacterium]HPN35125.1 PorV/PorQ family protein [bacterium]